jgi:hypothetical protein
MLEELPDLRGLPLQRAETPRRGLLEFFPVAGGRASRYLLLEIAVEILVRIEFGRVRREVVNREQFRMRLDPCADLLRLVHVQVVEDEHHLAARVLSQPLEERQQRRRIDGFLEDHEA